MKELERLRAYLDTLEREIKSATEDAYQRGFDEGVATTPDHKRFHEEHKQPHHYGEDGEIVVISGRLAHSTAVNRIYDLLRDDADYSKEEIESNTRSEKIALALEDDECEYYASRNREGIFDAWVWRP